MNLDEVSFSAIKPCESDNHDTFTYNVYSLPRCKISGVYSFVLMNKHSGYTNGHKIINVSVLWGLTCLTWTYMYRISMPYIF